MKEIETAPVPTSHDFETKLDAARPSDDGARRFLRTLLAAAIDAADPAKTLLSHLPEPPKGRCVIIGAGKAAGSMAAAVEAAWPEIDISGVVATPYGYNVPCQKVRVIEAGHPVPDENSVGAAAEIMATVRNLSPDDLVLALISGGGSAAMCLPAPGITLQDKQLTNKLLLASGLDIRTMNAVRRRISAVKGGKLGAAVMPARLVTLAISDIPGDDPSAIASGPTILPASEENDLSLVVKRLGPDLPRSVVDRLLQDGETHTASYPSEVRLIAKPGDSLAAAARIAEAHGIRALLLGDSLEGESRALATDMARKALAQETSAVLISGGETTVTINGKDAGRGGRNTEFILALATELQGRANIWALAADTDGEDGASLGAAGAIATPDTLERAMKAGLDPVHYLQSHDSGTFFEQLGDLIVTGATRTNVNDFRAVLVLPTLKS